MSLLIETLRLVIDLFTSSSSPLTYTYRYRQRGTGFKVTENISDVAVTSPKGQICSRNLLEARSAFKNGNECVLLSLIVSLMLMAYVA